MNKEVITKAVGKIGLKLKVKSPEILMAFGIISVTAGAILACKASMNLGETIEEIEKEKADIEERKEVAETDEEFKALKKEGAKHYIRSAGRIAKIYAVPAGLFTSGIGMMCASHGIMKGRNAALVSAYNSLDAAYKEYKEYIKEKYGEENVLGDILPGEILKDSKDEEGNEKPEGKLFTEGKNPTDYSVYARFFDELNPLWTNDPVHNLAYLKAQQQIANNTLKSRGYIFLNEVYRALGIPETKESRVVGWLDNGKGDGFVDFNIYNGYRQEAREFVNGYNNAILLDFNVDGVIIDDFEKVGRLRS